VDRQVRLGGQAARRREMNIRQANGIGRVHVAKPQLRETYCGRPINDEDWVTTTKEANCTGCARAGAPGLDRTTAHHADPRVRKEVVPAFRLAPYVR
jgi:hypothetical protein